MGALRVGLVAIFIFLAASVYAVNPFLGAADDRPVSANFRGTEWSDDIEEEEIPLTARVITSRVAKMPWGAIFKIEFVDLKSRAPQQRKIELEYFIVTDGRIALLNEENMPEAIKRLSAAENPPESEAGDIYGITSGKFDHEDALWKTTIRLKGDLCVYEASHPSGHFKRWFGKTELDQLSTGAATALGLTAIASNASHQRRSEV